MDEKLDFKFSKYDLNFLIRLKIYEFRKQNIDNINEQQIKSYLFDYKWKKKKSIPMCELVNDIMSLEFSELFDYLSVPDDIYNLEGAVLPTVFYIENNTVVGALSAPVDEQEMIYASGIFFGEDSIARLN